MGNGMNKVLPGLYLGNFRDAKDMDQLTKNNITHILAIHDNAQPVLEAFKQCNSLQNQFLHKAQHSVYISCCSPRHLEYKCIHAADSPDQEISGFFQESIDFIHKCRLNNGVCLVHCMAGVSRSTSLVAAYIMAVTQLNWRDAIKAIKCSRSIANPNYGFQRQLQDFYNLHASKERERLEREFPNTDFKDEEYLLELMANNEEKDLSEEDAVMNALCRHTNRTKINSISKQSHEDEEATINSELKD